MHEITRLIQDKYQARMTKDQRAAFRNMLTEKLAAQGIEVAHEPVAMSATNLVVGDLSRAEYIFTAHYNTFRKLPVPIVMAPMGIRSLISSLYSAGLLSLLAMLPTLLVALIFPVFRNAYLFIAHLSIVVFLLLSYGEPNEHTANDNTSGVCVLVEALLSLPKEARERGMFVFFDRDNPFVVGSAYFKALHGEKIAHIPLINFDCVSDGDVLACMVHKALHGNALQMDKIRAALPTMEGKQWRIFKVESTQNSSDAMHFDKAMGVVALRRSRVFGLHIRGIRTRHDIHFDTRNIAFLRDFIANLLAKDAA